MLFFGRNSTRGIIDTDAWDLNLLVVSLVGVLSHNLFFLVLAAETSDNVHNTLQVSLRGFGHLLSGF